MILAIIFFVIILDQITKYLAIGLKNGSIKLVENFMELVYVENRGAAFGILQGKKIILVFFTFFIIAALCYFLYKSRNRLSTISKVSISLIIGGAIGNLIDRVFRHFVIDFISVTFPNGYEFPVFNVADIAVVCGTFLLIIAFVKTDDFEEIQ
ncbi:signal peptidase II [Lagierella massiliensis]|uniref:signal peptidase II n=1 Tax=Lagierella massiliensis TaxID=1689303 RepID=UPI0006D7C112|nr:signal peptidase II [Lagierella massiliensis]